VAYSQLAMNKYQGIIIPPKYYQPIAQQLVIIKSSQQVKLAQQISDFILQENNQEKLFQLGYLPIQSIQLIEKNSQVNTQYD
jgi:molybdate transport system substrate-binding protein